ncbi:MAG: helix-turn-helix transcriptional regulator [Sphingomonas sp.]
MKSSDERADTNLLATALKLIRKDRRMRPSEVAQALGMPLRSYEHLESGRGRFTFDRLVRFTEVTNSDPFAILAVLALKTPEFALRCADNKLMTILMIAMSEMNDDLGDDITFLESGILIGAFTRVAKELTEHISKRDLFAETWLKERSTKIQGARALDRLRRRTTD